MGFLYIFVIQTIILHFVCCFPSCKYYLNRRREGVFRYDRHTRYQLTYQDAQAACLQDFGATLATREQLLEALKSGLEECRAGWIILAEVAYPRVNKHWNCGENKTGIISYGIRQNLQEKWDVFCYKKDDDCSPYDRVYNGLATTIPETQTLYESTGIEETTKDTLINLQTNTLVTANHGLKQNTIHQQPMSPHVDFTTDARYNNVTVAHNSYTHKAKQPPLQSKLDIDSTSSITNTSISSPKALEGVTRQDELSTTTATNYSYISLNSKEVPQTNNMSKATMEHKVFITTEPNLYTASSTNARHITLKNGTDVNVLEYILQGSQQTLRNSNTGDYEVSSISFIPMTTERNFMRKTSSTLDQQHFSQTPPTESEDKTKMFFNKASLSSILITENPVSIPTPENVKIKVASDSSSEYQNTVTTDKNTFISPTMSSFNTEIFYKETRNVNNNKEDNSLSVTPKNPYFPTVTLTVGNQVTSQLNEEDSRIYSILSTNKPSSVPLLVSFVDTREENHRVEPNVNMTWEDLHSSHHNELNIDENVTFSSLNLKKNEGALVNGGENVITFETTTMSAFNSNGITEKSTGTERHETGSLTGNLTLLKTVTPGIKLVTNSSQLSNMSMKEDILLPVSLEKYDSKVTNSHEALTTAMVTSFQKQPHPTLETDEASILPTTPSVKITDPIGPNSQLSKPLDTCGGVFKGNAAQFQSPGFPQSYPSDMNCTWVIEAPVGYYIILMFRSLVLEEHRNCQYDYVLVYDGKESDNKQLGRFCGSQLPSPLRATSNVLTVIMRSDSSVELDGISVQFSSIKYISEGIRLNDGKNPFEGLVEVEYQGMRGSICAKQWSNKDAQVVCRQLGYSGPAVATRILGKNNTSVAISFVSCDGNEAALENCNMKNSGSCGTQERAGVICQVLESCAALKDAGVQESGIYAIDPDGVGEGDNHFTVDCDMNSDSTTGITIIGHDSEGRERVSSCEDPGCYSRIIKYNGASMNQLRLLTSISESCEQFVRLECRHIRFLNGPWGWWISRDGHQINSWGGADTNSGRCACGESGECALEGTSCNCDANDDVWRTDEGVLTDKATLPVQEVRFGDTRDAPMEMAFHSIGKLRCWGTISEPPILQSCAALKEAGITDSGRYIIDPDGVGQGVSQFEVFCDMSSDSGITVISHNSERRMRVTPCEEAGCYKRELTYNAELSQLNALTKVSQRCEQFVRLDCRHIRFIESGFGWWVSWDGKRMNYWGGANPATGGCACGKTGTCSAPDKVCNCDSNDQVWRTDDGFLRDKDALPVKAVHFGDTNDFPLEMAYHTIGKLRCRGQAR
ncbi:uncharacterized protein LOC128659456 [Bombina bombina]|uniref:uncharacterized protein LOC128659456 n=1 Tax=Bombina bombina TaxID=8345 RepID=UPI00235A5426|nr:uncharacterized protein LOC128659456 [Bombina bombina]